MESEISPILEVLLFIVAGGLFLAGGLLTAKIIRPSRPGAQKLESYESGEEPLGEAWGRVNIRFYLLALIFLLFEVEIVFLFPWAIVFGKEELIESTQGKWGWYTLIEMFIFLGILFLGLLFAWKKGFLEWPGSKIKKLPVGSPVPRQLYEAVNEKYKRA